MDIATARSLQSALETNLALNAGAKRFVIGDREQWLDPQEQTQLLDWVNNQIARYDRRAAGKNPYYKIAKWR